MDVTNAISSGIKQMLDQGVPDLVVPAVRPDQQFNHEPDEFRFVVQRLQSYAQEVPFSKQQIRNIIKNRSLVEALNGDRTSDRLAALAVLGKGVGVEYFAAETPVDPGDKGALKQAIENRLERLFGTAIEGEVVES